MIDGDQVRVQTFVRVPLQAAFDVFTLELDAWWRTGPAYRVGGKQPGTLHLEPRLGGRIFEQYGPGGSALHAIGTITAWAPPTHFAFSWRGINFRPDDPDTLVEVSFEGTDTGTRVTLVHRGFAAVRADHPVRHGQSVSGFLRELGLWWASLLTSLRERADPVE